MADWDRERQGRQSENDSDWDWYYYEYRYEPHTYGDRERFARESGQNYGRGSGQDYGRNYGRGYENDFNRGGYGQEYGRNSGQNYGRYNQDYERGYQGNYGPYGNAGTWNRGRYSGVGPRGYQRSDNRMQEDINDRLTWHGQIDATDVQVEVANGVVTLSGSVNSRREKRIAEDVAEDVPGVKDVQNNLRVSDQAGQNRDENETRSAQQSQGQEATAETSRKRR
jgi:hypothetical protein